MKRIIILFLLSFIIISPIFSQNGWRKDEMEIKVNLKAENHPEKLYNLKLNGDFYKDYALLYVIPSELDKIEKLGIEYEITIQNLNEHYKDFWKNKAQYHSYQDIIDSMNYLATNYPNICKKIDYGTSVGGRELTTLVISDNVNTPENEAEIIFDGGIHGDEIICSEIVIRLAEDLCAGYGNDPTITNLIDNREIWLYCMVNPDARVNNTRYNNNGVDCNRDAGYMWDGWGSSTGAFSQPESKALRDCFYNNQFVVHTTYHAGTEYISLPWSYRSDVCPDFDYIEDLAEEYVNSSTYPSLDYGQGNTGMYAINGSTKDSNYGMMGSISWSMEVSNDKQLPVSELLQYYNYNYPAMISMIEHAGYGLQGVVTDANTGDPINAIVFVGDNFPTYTDPEVGDFHKYVIPGTYSVKIVANGYETQTIDNITVTDDAATTVDFQLVPIEDENVYNAYKVASSRIPDNNEADEGYTPAAFGKPDNINYSIGKNGWIVLDMQVPIIDGFGPDLTVYEGDSSPESYNCYISESADGPWSLIGSGTGTTDFDINGAVSSGQFIKIEDDGDGQQTADNAGFDLDAIETIEHQSGTFINLVDYVIDDSGSGNNNGQLDPGETADLIVTLRNNGDIPAVNTIGTLSSEDDYVTVIDFIKNFGDIGYLSNSEATFSIEADPAMPTQYTSNLNLNVIANDSAVNQNFDIYLFTGTAMEDWETGGFEQFYWDFSGSANWFTTTTDPYEGVYCSQSGDITDEQTTVLLTTAIVLSEGEISFARKVSSESGYDYLRFYIDGTEMDSWSGEQDWSEVTYDVSAGTHVFKWVYEKDVYVSNGDDCGWIDNIIFPPSLFLWAEAGQNQTINFDETCSLTGNALNQSSVEWTTDGTGSFDDQTSLQTIYTPSTEDINNEGVTLTLTAYDDNDNAFSDNLFLTIIPEVSIKEQKMEVSIFPNPTNGILNIKLNNNSNNISLKLISLTGSTIYKNNYKTEQNNNLINLDLSNLSAGTYFLKIQDDKSVKVKKIIIDQ